MKLHPPCRGLRRYGPCFVFLWAAWAGVPLGAQPVPAPPGPGPAHDFVFLTEARPLLIRVAVRVDGKPLEAAWNNFFDHLFLHLDVKVQGYLGKAEVERAPPLNHILSGNLGSFGNIYSGGSKVPAYPTLKDFDADSNGKVSKAKLAAYYRKQGFVPFQFQPEKDKGGEAAGARMMMMGMGKGLSEPSVDEVAAAIFSLLDTKKTGKLTRAELTAAPELLLRKDANEDEMITAAELATNNHPQAPNAFSMAISSFKNTFATPSLDGGERVFPIAAPGEVPPGMVTRMLKQYGKGGKVARKEIGLDETTFAALDANRDGVLDANELAGFVKRAPDFEYMVHLNSASSAPLGVEMMPSRSGLALAANKILAFDGLALLDLGPTRVELVGDAASQEDRFSRFMNAQWTILFKQADKNGDGYLDEKEASTSVFGSAFKAMDRDGDGKVSEQELQAYLDLLVDLKTRAQKACVAVVVTDESRGLFDVLDRNRDGRLSVREMRGAVDLLTKVGPKGKDHLTRADLPRTYRLTVRRGPAADTSNDYNRIIERIYGGGATAPLAKATTRGPAWFRKMDKNRDGDVSRREWLGTEEQFRQIDTDGDGLISAEEAERFDAQRRQVK